MDHWDRGRGELARHEQQDSAGQSDPATPWPGDPYSRPDGTYRTPSRRRARHRGAPDPVDSYTPSWARESTQAIQPTESTDFRALADTSTWASDPDPSRRDAGRHHRQDPVTGPVPGSGAPTGSTGRRRVAPEVSWDSTGEYWRSPARAGDDQPGDDRTSDDRTSDDRPSYEAADRRWRSAGGTGGWRRDTATGPTGTGTGGGRGPRRAGADRYSGDDDGWVAAAPTSGWAAAPTTGGWAAEAPTSGGWAAAAPTTGAGGGAGRLDEPPTTPRRGRRHRTESDDPSGVPGSGRDTGVAGSRSGMGLDATGNRLDQPRESGSGSRNRTGGPGTGGPGTGGPGTGEPSVGGRERGAADPRVPGRRRRAEPAGWERDDPSESGRPAGERGSSRHRTDDPANATAWSAPTEPAPTEPGRQAGQSPAAARWVRSPGEDDPRYDAGRRSWSTERRPGRPEVGARRREPDAEPVRRYQDAEPVRRADQDAGPVRRTGQDRGGQGRHADPGPGRRADPGRASWRTDPGPWDRLTDTGMLDRVTDPEPPDGVGGSRRRDRSTDAGQWDRFTDTTEWRPDELAGLVRDGGDSRAGRSAPDTRRTGPDSTETFWSGTRLAGDDPRWMGIPDSAPRSPAVAYPPLSSPATPVRRQGEPGSPIRRRAEPAGAPGRAGSLGSARSVSGAGSTTTARRSPAGRGGTGSARRGGSALAGRQRPSPLSRRLEDDLLDPQPSGPLTAVLYTAAWYAVAVLAVFVWVLTLDASVPVDCVPGVSGSCDSERGQAISALLDAVPRFAAALATGLVVAALMRWFNRTWRAVTVGLAAAVVGGGLSTVLFSVVSGRPLG